MKKQRLLSLNMKNLMIVIASIFILNSCSDKDQLIGKWDDVIKLSTKHVDLEAKTDSATITTKGDGWWIDAITFEDSIYSYYGREDINLESHSFRIIEKHFLVEKRDKNTLFVKINENNTEDDRVMNITFEAGDYFDYVNIQQAGK
ncbi:hypothetical protein [Saccharicrinis fermentans]|uniref:Uncharacterized protein n=1 Tax=Saccharicrinis fermentans DSM 9555 = JCM 21142 TaxID=869213 RepID=W7Y2S5_9BACT|nr:hypothetical protein [Saccharicrinis fermentans]GAF02287.1 hypothetical protein JCM21142_3916 [Saccharicrinis fermentans DSM 9555 = JCM 21142]